MIQKNPELTTKAAAIAAFVVSDLYLETFYYIALLGTNPPSALTIANQAVANVNTSGNLASSPINSYYWNGTIQITFIKVFDNAVNIEIDVIF